MAILLLDRLLFKPAAAWKSETGDHINKPASVFFLATPQASGAMLVHNALDQAWGGALVANKRSLPTLNGRLLPYLAWHLKFRFAAETYANLARHELDIKVCIENRPDENTSIRNVANFSTQWNRDSGEVEIDHDPPGWVGSGFKPSAAVTTPDEWHYLDFRYSFNEAARTFSIESMMWDHEFYEMPAEHKNIPMQQTNWEQVCALQIQNEGYQPGTVLIEYDEGLMAWSDEPIGSLAATLAFL